MVREEVKKFIESRPDALGVYGYGSANFKQLGYDDMNKPEIDLMFVVENIAKWSREHASECDGLTYTTRHYFKNASDKEIYGKYGTYFLVSIPFNDSVFKIMVCDKSSFMFSNVLFSHYLAAARCQKLIQPYKSNDELDLYIGSSRRSAAIVGMMLNEKEVNFNDLLVSICGLSYIGDIRMKYGEKPTKVVDMVNGSLDEYRELYLPIVNKLYTVNDDIVINSNTIRSYYKYLPDYLKNHIRRGISDGDIKQLIYEYYNGMNKTASSYLISQGLKLNGIPRTVSYGSKKVLKRFKK